VFVSGLGAGEITGFTLVNAETNRMIGPLNDGDTVDLSKVGGELNVRADVSGQVGSVRFAYDKDAEISGELRKWHKITLTFDGPEISETSTPNPFLDFRLNVLFRQGDRKYLVPGYFAADGDAAQTGADSGNKWRAHFAPDATGPWRDGRDPSCRSELRRKCLERRRVLRLVCLPPDRH